MDRAGEDRGVVVKINTSKALKDIRGSGLVIKMGMADAVANKGAATRRESLFVFFFFSFLFSLFSQRKTWHGQHVKAHKWMGQVKMWWLNPIPSMS